MEEKSIVSERDYIRGMLVATAKELQGSGFKQEFITKTKINKLICILSDNLDIPITKSWYNYGQNVFTHGLGIKLDDFFISIFKDVESQLKLLKGLSYECFVKTQNFYKKFDVVNKIFKKDFNHFLEQYYNNSNFDDMRYIGVYRNFFHLNSFIWNDFKKGIFYNKEIAKPDYTKFLLEETDFVEQDTLFNSYVSKKDTKRSLFNSFLFELEKSTYNFPNGIRYKVYNAFDDFEKVCLKLDIISEQTEVKPFQKSTFDEIYEICKWYWSILTSFISTKENMGLRTSTLIPFYNKQVADRLSKEFTKKKLMEGKIEKNKLQLNLEEFKKLRIENKEMTNLVHTFTTNI